MSAPNRGQRGSSTTARGAGRGNTSGTARGGRGNARAASTNAFGRGRGRGAARGAAAAGDGAGLLQQMRTGTVQRNNSDGTQGSGRGM